MVLLAYLFVSAPSQLPDEMHAGMKIPVAKMFEILNGENQAVRQNWTQTVGDGKKVGLDFNEKWKEPGVDAGPLPALFLRETGSALVKSPTMLRLFLGSDFPIVAANKFGGVQQAKLNEIRVDGEPKFFFDPGSKMYMAMFADRAVAAGCVDCHNKHPNSPKNDWKLNDIMGATTWAYPNEYVSTEDVLKNIFFLRNGFRTAYESYVQKAQTFKVKPEFGEKWPVDGLFMPTLEVFVKTYEQGNSVRSLVEVTRVIAPNPLNDVTKRLVKGEDKQSVKELNEVKKPEHRDAPL
jgi:hypothetical protein